MPHCHLRHSFATLLAAATLLFTACGGHDHAHSAKGSDGHSHGHAHTAPHGGLLVELGDHQFNLELLLDRATGTLTAYMLDAHAEDFVRVEWPELTLAFTSPTGRFLAIAAVADPLTQETVGNTSQFSAHADWLIDTADYSGTIPALSIKGTPVPAATFILSTAPAHHDHDHSGHGHSP